MKAIQIAAPGAAFELVERTIPEPQPNELLIKVQACGVCHGEAILKGGHFPGLSYPRIPGHEVIGTISKMGSNIEGWQVGQRVGVGWHGGHCRSCSACRRGEFSACAQSTVTGITIDGGYAEYMIAQSEAAVEIPSRLDSYEAAPLICAGRTVFGALKSSDARGGDLVAIQGIGGLGHLAVQYSRRLGFRTVALSRGVEKQQDSLRFGAHTYLDTDSGDVAQKLEQMGGARVILCTAPNGKAISQLVDGLGRNGKIIMVSAPPDMLQFHPGLLLKGGRSIGGFVSGRIEDALDFSVLSGVMPAVELFTLEQAAAAFDKMMTAKVRFRAVLRVG